MHVEETPEWRAGYAAGRRQVWMLLLKMCMQGLGDSVDADSRGHLAWRVEREETLLMLRHLCDEYGDMNWEDDLHLADVLEKHLLPHLAKQP
jgi:hypothetical protein